MPTLQMYCGGDLSYQSVRYCINILRQSYFQSFSEDKLFHGGVAGRQIPVGQLSHSLYTRLIPLGFRYAGFRCYYTPFAPPGLLEADKISIALIIHSLDCSARLTDLRREPSYCRIAIIAPLMAFLLIDPSLSEKDLSYDPTLILFLHLFWRQGVYTVGPFDVINIDLKRTRGN